MKNAGFAGSATQYLPAGDPAAPYLYAVKAQRTPCGADPYCVVVPEPKAFNYADGIPLTYPAMVGYRAYLNPHTQSGPDYDDIIHDGAIWFQVR
jgi:hypothetical protein